MKAGDGSFLKKHIRVLVCLFFQTKKSSYCDYCGAFVVVSIVVIIGIQKLEDITDKCWQLLAVFLSCSKSVFYFFFPANHLMSV